MEEVKEHPFFSTINWDALENRQIEAEYKPAVSEEEKQQHLLLSDPQSSAQNGSSQGANNGPIGHSILEEDAKEEVTQQQVDYVRQH